MDALDGSLQQAGSAPPGVIWDKARAQQASCLLNKQSARPVVTKRVEFKTTQDFYLQ
jgi:hypothetical protein